MLQAESIEVLKMNKLFDEKLDNLPIRKMKNQFIEEARVSKDKPNFHQYNHSRMSQSHLNFQYNNVPYN